MLYSVEKYLGATRCKEYQVLTFALNLPRLPLLWDSQWILGFSPAALCSYYRSAASGIVAIGPPNRGEFLQIVESKGLRPGES
jgi:hypothetical protein